MPHIKSNHFYSSYLTALALLAVSVAPPALGAGSNPESDEQKATRERAELSDAQANMARAFADFYQALRSGGPQANADALQTRFLGPAQDKMTSLLNKRREDRDKMVYGKVYFPDGNIMDAKEFEKDPRSGKYTQSDGESDAAEPDNEDGETPSPEKKGGEKRLETVNSGFSGGATGSPGFSSTSEAFKRPEWVLDGSKTPKEIVFEGPAASAQAPQEDKKKPGAPKKLRAPAAARK